MAQVTLTTEQLESTKALARRHHSSCVRFDALGPPPRSKIGTVSVEVFASGGWWEEYEVQVDGACFLPGGRTPVPL